MKNLADLSENILKLQGGGGRICNKFYRPEITTKNTFNGLNSPNLSTSI